MMAQKFVERFEQTREAVLGIAPQLADSPQFRAPSELLGTERMIGFVQGLFVNMVSALSAITLVLVLRGMQNHQPQAETACLLSS